MKKKISDKTLKKSWKIWYLWHGCSQQGENLLGNSMAHTMTPIIEELYDTKEEKSEAYHRHLTLFNTEQQLGAIAPGIICGAEEAVANKEIDGEMANAIKVALIGPTSAIGDSVWVATIIPIILTLVMTITNFGGYFTYIGPMLYIIGYPLVTTLISWNMWQIGYKTGVEGIQKIMESGKMTQITNAVTLLGLIVIGALAASFVNFTIPITLTPPGGESAAVDVTEMINRIFPNILPLLLTFGVYQLYAKKKKTPLFIMMVLLIVALVLTGIGFWVGYY